MTDSLQRTSPETATPTYHELLTRLDAIQNLADAEDVAAWLMPLLHTRDHAQTAPVPVMRELTPDEEEMMMKALRNSGGHITYLEPAQTPAVRLEARPADDSQPWTEIFPAQLQWVAKQGHQVRAIELSDTSTREHSK